MPNEKLQINIPVSGMKNATQRRTRSFLCCSCLGPSESMSDSAITVTLGKYDECEYVVEKLAIKRIPTKLLSQDESAVKVEKGPSDTSQFSQLEDFGTEKDKKSTGITFSSYYKMVPNKTSPGKISQIRDRTESSILSLSDYNTEQIQNFDVTSQNDNVGYQRTIDKDKYKDEKHYYNANKNIKSQIDSDKKVTSSLIENGSEYDKKPKYFIPPILENNKIIDPEIRKTLQILGGAPAGENIHRFYHNFAKGPIRCVDSGIAKYREGENLHEEPISVSVRSRFDADDYSDVYSRDYSVSCDTTRPKRNGLKWKILIKHHDKKNHRGQRSQKMAED